MDNTAVKIIDLFCGAGGLSEGFKQAGFDIALGIDFDENSILTYNTNFIGKGYNKNLAKTNSNELLALSNIKKDDQCIVIAGPPCQGFSIVNGRRDEIFEENTLLIRTAQLIRDINPIFFIVENVEPIKSVEDGHSFNRFSRIINEETNFEWDSVVLNAVNFGIPQKRKRIFLIGNRLQIPDAFPVGNSGKIITVKEAISDLPMINPKNGGENPTEYNGEPVNEYQKLMKENALEKLWNHIITINSDKIIERYKQIKPGESYIDAINRMKKNDRIKVKFSNVYRRFKADDAAPTIANPRKSMYIHYEQNRGLSIREAARLQSFPDKFIFKGGKSSQQQQVANAVPPLLARAIALHIKNPITEHLKFKKI